MFVFIQNDEGLSLYLQCTNLIRQNITLKNCIGKNRFPFPAVSSFRLNILGIDSILCKTSIENPMKIAYRQDLRKIPWLNFSHELRIYDCNIIMLDHDPFMSYDKAAPNKTPKPTTCFQTHFGALFFLEKCHSPRTQDPKIIEIPISKANFNFIKLGFHKHPN